MIELLFPILLFPICGVLAGGVAWAFLRGDSTDDGSLFRGFMVVFVLAVMLFQGLVKTDKVRAKLDPAFSLQAELDAHPVYAAMKMYAQTEHAELHKALMADGLNGAGVPAMFVTARPLLASLGTKNMGFADAANRIAWAQMYVDTLVELREHSPEDCFLVLTKRPEANQILATGLSEANSKAFQPVFVSLLKSSYEGMGSHPARPTVEFNEASRQWGVLMDSLKDRYGAATVELLSRKQFAAVPSDSHGIVCSARIAQMNLLLQQPETMAGMLVDSAMR